MSASFRNLTTMSRRDVIKSMRLAFLASVSVMIGCSSLEVDRQNVEIAGFSADPGPSWEHWRSTVRLGLEGKFMVDGDLALRDEATVRAFYESEVRRNRGGQALTVNRVTTGGITLDDTWGAPRNFALTYCVADAFGENQQVLEDALVEATLSWEQLAAVDFRHLAVAAPCDRENAEVIFDVRPAPGGSAFFAQAFFPGDPRASRSLLVAEDAFTTRSGGRDLQGILRHELGHALGFRHEHIWIPRCAREGTDSARQITDYDEESVMHSPECRVPAGGDTDRPSWTMSARLSSMDWRLS